MKLTVHYNNCAQYNVNVPAGNGQAGKSPDSRMTNPSWVPIGANFYFYHIDKFFFKLQNTLHHTILKILIFRNVAGFNEDIIFAPYL